jgi:hypothetical protein
VSRLKAMEQNPDISLASKKNAWAKLLNTYGTDNPLSGEDEKLRQYAEGRISALDGKIAEAERVAVVDLKGDWDTNANGHTGIISITDQTGSQFSGTFFGINKVVNGNIVSNIVAFTRPYTSSGPGHQDYTGTLTVDSNGTATMTGTRKPFPTALPEVLGLRLTGRLSPPRELWQGIMGTP